MGYYIYLWLGLPLGLFWAVAARYGDDKQKLTWADLVKLDAILMGSTLATSLVLGVGDYLSHNDSFRMVATMHEKSYLAGILGGIITTIYIYTARNKLATPATGVLQLEANGIRINLANLLGGNL